MDNSNEELKKKVSKHRRDQVGVISPDVIASAQATQKALDQKGVTMPQDVNTGNPQASTKLKAGKEGARKVSFKEGATDECGNQI
ncbi:MAG: hypothetical protein ACJAW3_000035 [Lentimonas sp.]|jgi:hypothetical protein